MIALIAAAILSTVPADAPQTVSPANVNGAQAKPKPTEVVCRTEELSGSRLTKRVCGTRSDWERNEEASHRAIKELQDRTGLDVHADPMGFHPELLIKR